MYMKYNQKINSGRTFLAIALLILMFSLASCGGSNSVNNARSPSYSKSSPIVEVLAQPSFAASEEVRSRFVAMPNWMNPTVRAMVYYNEPDDAYTSGTVVGYFKACASLSNADYNTIVKNHLEMIELHSTDFSLYKNGIPNDLLINKRKKLFYKGLAEGERAAKVIKHKIQRDFCGDTLNEMRKSIWELAS